MISVILSTYNRKLKLTKTLDSFSNLKRPKCNWKLVIVNNSSTDGSKEIIEMFKEILPIEYIEEPQLGKNIALNKALHKVDQGLIVFTDDDIVFQEDWLIRYEEISKKHPEYSIFGGTILPGGDAEFPENIPEYIIKIKDIVWSRAYALTDSRWTDGQIIPDFIWGPNMAIRSAVFKTGYRFNESIGPSGSNYAQGGETELVKRLVKNGYKCWHIKDAVVFHCIDSHQFTKEWLYKRAFRYGRGRFLLQLIHHKKYQISVFGYPIILLLSAIKSSAWMLPLFLFSHGKHTHHIVKHNWKINEIFGALSEARRTYLSEIKLKKQKTISYYKH